jgi:hypothetical protein
MHVGSRNQFSLSDFHFGIEEESSEERNLSRTADNMNRAEITSTISEYGMGSLASG